MTVPTDQTNPAPKPWAIILAAGKGTRMRSDLPKVVHEVGGRAMVCAVVEACLSAGCERVVAVVGYRKDRVGAALGDLPVDLAVQDEQLGTGHAVLCARRVLPPPEPGRPVFVLCGDGPLIRPKTLRTLLARHRERGASATLATAVVDDPSGYGRIVRDGAGRFRAIVEEKVATPDQRAICEVNPSYYCFDAGRLFDALGRIDRDPVSGEYYLTDVPGLMLEAGEPVEVVEAVAPQDVLSINTPEDLAAVDRLYRSRAGAGSEAAR